MTFPLRFSQPSELEQWREERARVSARMERRQRREFTERRDAIARVLIWALFTVAVLSGAVLGIHT